MTTMEKAQITIAILTALTPTVAVFLATLIQRQDVTDLRGEMNGLRNEMLQLRKDMQQEMLNLRNQVHADLLMIHERVCES